MLELIIFALHAQRSKPSITLVTPLCQTLSLKK
jgi:hypothetical protein